MRILVADDHELTRSQLEALLLQLGHEPVLAADGSEAWELLHTCDPPELAILDWMMPPPDGPEICRRLRAAAKRPYQYIIMLTARDSVDDLAEGFDAGADDYLRKPFDMRELRARIRAGERTLALQDELRAQATQDELTGLLNRRGIMERLEKEVAVSRRTGSPLSIVLADLDSFKVINDTHGHPVGDEVLRDTANRLKRQLRSYDDLGRYGGEEFIAVLPACAKADAIAVAERLRRAIADGPVSTSAGAVSITLSAGVASADADHPLSSSAIVSAADAALYRAKRGGRNRVESENS